MEQQLTLKSGCSKEWHIVQSEKVKGQCFIEVGKQVNWLCQVITGSGRSSNPLKRTRTFEHMRRHILETLDPAPAGGGAGEPDDDPMASLGMEGTQRQPRRKVVHKLKSKSAKGQGAAPRIMDVEMPQGSCVKVLVKYLAAAKTSGSKNYGHNTSLWVLQSHLPSLLASLRNEWSDRGIDLVEDDGELAPASEEDDIGDAGSGKFVVVFDHRDGAFVVKVRQRIIQRFYVRKREVGSQKLLSGDAYKRVMEDTRLAANAWAMANLTSVEEHQ